jgi:uncharacterized protein (DUF934 family)
MPLVKHDAVVEDRWIRLDDDAPLVDGPVIVSLERWLEERDELARRNGPLGIVLTGAETPEQIVDDLDRFALICLDFPRFTDGRAYSHARKLRQRYGFTGELRAVGNVLRDQFLFMQRCGFDAFEVAPGTALEDWMRATREISVAYQSAADRRATAIERRQEPCTAC